MKILNGIHTEAKIFTNTVEETAIKQIQNLIDNESTKGTKVRIMPDVHAGKGTTIGTTIRLPENFADWKVCPNIVGVDINCGVLMYKLNIKENEVDLGKLDEVVNKMIPSGFNVHNKCQDEKLAEEVLDNLTLDLDSKTSERIKMSLGTLGGGNHFIELGVDEEGSYWLSVHSGSRNLGVQVAKTHQDKAIKNMKESRVDIKGTIERLKAEGKHKEISKTIMKLKEESKGVKYADEALAYLQGEELKDYLIDMDLAQKYAVASRHKMLNIIVESMDFEVIDKFDSVHNFIEHNNFKSGTIRKGATSAKVGERLVIPLNMRDGSLICIGKGNADWNESAPHGAGRTMSRSQAKKKINLVDFQDQMIDVYSSSVSEATLDEAPDAYKPAEVIIENIKDTVDIVHIVKPVYNFKAH